MRNDPGKRAKANDGGFNERRSAFFPQLVGIDAFATAFDFHLSGATSPIPDADGFAFVITSSGPNALGSAGGRTRLWPLIAQPARQDDYDGINLVETIADQVNYAVFTQL